MVCLMMCGGAAIAQDEDYYEGVDEFYEGADDFIPDEGGGDTYIYNEGDTFIFPYPDYGYNPCVGCSPWMLKHSYPASEWDNVHGGHLPARPNYGGMTNYNSPGGRD